MKKYRALTPMAMEIDRILSELRRALRKPMEAEIARGHLTWPQQNVMAVLVRSSGISLKDLSKQMGLAHATVSGIVDRLERRGLAERQPNPSDRRSTKIVASETVFRFMRGTLPNLTLQPLLSALGRARPGERKKIIEGLRTLHALISRE
jgi:DNA-binding MarR family transcriptional regulator